MFTAASTVLRGLAGAAAPSCTGGVTLPRPVRNSRTVSPRVAGLSALTSEKSAWRIAPGPIPAGGTVKIPGLVFAIGTVTVFDFTPLLVTTIVALPGAAVA